MNLWKTYENPMKNQGGNTWVENFKAPNTQATWGQWLESGERIVDDGPEEEVQ